MENNSRVLAYSLAKEISLDDLKEVSGGNNAGFATSKGTARMTGLSDAGRDYEADIGIDW